MRGEGVHVNKENKCDREINFIFKLIRGYLQTTGCIKI